MQAPKLVPAATLKVARYKRSPSTSFTAGSLRMRVTKIVAGRLLKMMQAIQVNALKKSAVTRSPMRVIGAMQVRARNCAMVDVKW